MYLERRHRVWYALHDVPPDAQATVGNDGKPRRRFVQSLKTEDWDTAKVRAALLETQWRAAINRARTGGASDLEEQAAFYRAALQSASPVEREAVMDRLTDEAERIATEIDGVPFHYADAGENAEAREGYRAGLKLIGLATGSLVKLTEHADEYLATLRCEQKTIDMARSTMTKFCAEFTYVEDVTRKAVQLWVNRQVQDGKAVATVQRSLGELRGYWRYLQSVQAAPESSNPFEKLSMPANGKAAKQDERRPFSTADVLKLLAEARKRKDAALADLIELAMWTGARIEELSALMVERVNLAERYLEITDAKTAAGWRQVPIHSKLKPTIARLVGNRSDSFVLSALSANKYGDRAGAVGKRFSHMKTDLGFGAQYVFHSIRKTVATLFENAGVSEGIAADILGHEKKTMTYGLYSGGTSLKVKLAAIEKIGYGRG